MPAERLQQIAASHQLGDRPVGDARVDRDEAVEDQQAGPVPDGREPRLEVALAGVRFEHPRRRELARREARADVELLGEIVVGIEQIGVERR